MRDLHQEMAELKGLVSDLTGVVKVLVREVKTLKDTAPEAHGMTPERRLAIRRTAQASAAGNPGPRRSWNEQRAKELEAGRAQRTRS